LGVVLEGKVEVEVRGGSGSGVCEAWDLYVCCGRKKKRGRRVGLEKDL
jgi:hypothetical protein